MPTDLSALQGALAAGDARHGASVLGFADAEPEGPSALTLAGRLGWPRLPDLGEIEEALAEIEASIRDARRTLLDSIDLGEADHRAIRRILPSLEPHARLIPAGIALLRAMSR